MNKYREKIQQAEKDLGALTPGQKIDLLLDNFSEIRTVADASAIVYGQAECWECGIPLTPHTAHPPAGRDYCSGCAAALKREYAAEERRERRGIDNHRGDEE